MAPNIRLLHSDEAGRLVDELWLPFAREMAELDEYNALADDARADAVAYREEQLEATDTVIWVAEAADGEWAGYACATECESPPVFARGRSVNVDELYVAPGHRERGIGGALLQRAHEWGRTRGCRRSSLSVNVRNEAARSLYEANGYETRRLKMDRQL